MAAASTHLGSQVTGYPLFLSHLAQLIPLQRSLLLLNLQKAHWYYSAEVQDRLNKLHSAAPVASPGDDGAKVDAAPSGGDGAVEGDKGPDRQATELKEVQDLLNECGLWGLVRDKEEEAIQELERWGNLSVDGSSKAADNVYQQHPKANGEFQVVQISGLPFILHLPPGYTSDSATSPRPSMEAYKAFKRAQAIAHILGTLLQLLVTYQPSAPAVAYGRALLRPSNLHGVGVLPDAGVPQMGAPGAVPVVPPIPPRRRATLSITINLEAMLSLLIPLFLLSLKLAFLLWIFGRHASTTKRAVLFGMAAVYVIWEGWTMQRRRNALARAAAGAIAAAAGGAANAAAVRDRARDRQARRAQAAVNGVPPIPRRPPPQQPHGPAPEAVDPNPNPQPGVAPRARAREGARDAAAPGAPAPRPREPTSRLTPRYWLNWLAAIGLASEARELGLVPRSIAGRPVVPARGQGAVGGRPPLPAPGDQRKRALRTALVCVVLFFGTLSPEVEKKRRRALEKRERLLKQRKEARDRKAALAIVAARQPAVADRLGAAAALRPAVLPERTGVTSNASTPGVVEFENEKDFGMGTEEESFGSRLGASSPPASASPLASGSAAEASTSTRTEPAQPSSSLDPNSPSSYRQSSDHTSNGDFSSLASSSALSPPPLSPTVPVISDADLFADGFSEPDQILPPSPTEAVDETEEGTTDVETDEEGSGAEGEQAGAGEEGEVDQIVALF